MVANSRLVEPSSTQLTLSVGVKERPKKKKKMPENKVLIKMR